MRAVLATAQRITVLQFLLAEGGMVHLHGNRGQPPEPPIPGDPVMLHPRTEDPLGYMMLDIAGGTFLFVPTAPEGSRWFERAAYTIEVLRLNSRDHLPVARREAYGSYKARLTEYVHKRDSGAARPALRHMIEAIKRMQHPTVWSEMRRQCMKVPELMQLFELASEALTW